MKEKNQTNKQINITNLWPDISRSLSTDDVDSAGGNDDDDDKVDAIVWLFSLFVVEFVVFAGGDDNGTGAGKLH